MSAAPRRLGLIGCGRIARPVIDTWRDGGLAGWTITGVLARGMHDLGPLKSTDDPDAFFASPYELIVEAAGPPALAQHGVRALAVAEVWTVSAAALADEALLSAVRNAGEKAGHRLRVVSGAMAGLDGVAMASVDPEVELQLDIDLMPGEGPRSLVFCGTVREAAVRYPDGVNVAAAAALAGPGMDLARIRVSHPGAVPQRQLGLTATSRYGTVRASVSPLVGPGVHPVAASLVAALRETLKTVWVG